MSEQDRTHVSTKPRRSRPASTQKTTLQRPANDDKEAWKAYWEEQGQPWRTEPEIDVERQKYLDERRSIKPDIEQGIYSFKNIKLNRADVEWLLATHENGRGPIDWSNESQHKRKGLDLRGADLSGTELQRADLRRLPLARMIGGITWLEHYNKAAAIHLERTLLENAHLEGAILSYAYLNSARFPLAHLESSNPRDAQRAVDLGRSGSRASFIALMCSSMRGIAIHIPSKPDVTEGGCCKQTRTLRPLDPCRGREPLLEKLLR